MCIRDRPNRVYEVLNRKRGLTLEMVRKLHRNLGIPAESPVSYTHLDVYKRQPVIRTQSPSMATRRSSNQAA